MEIFDEDIAWLRSYVESKRVQGREVRSLEPGKDGQPSSDSQEGTGPTIVLIEDTWLELGSPGTNSVAPVLVTENRDLLEDGAITLIGPDVPEARGTIPFAQILLIASDEIQDEDYREINSAQYELELRGYMIKAIPSSLTIWSRVSVESARGGFSFGALGNAIIESYKTRFRIPAMELLFVTSSPEDVAEFDGLRSKVTRIIGAMNKMIEELSYDCSSCDYLDVCGDVRQLGALRERLMREREARARSDSARRPDPA